MSSESSSKVQEITTYEQYKNLIASGYSFIDFYATYCEPCKAFAPTYQKLAKAYPQINFYKLNCDTKDVNLRKVIKALGIKLVPTFCLFNNGKYALTLSKEDENDDRDYASMIEGAISQIKIVYYDDEQTTDKSVF
jgi:thioredoxin 1